MTDTTPTPPKMPADRLTDTSALISTYAPAMATPHWVDVDDFTRDCIAEMAAPRNRGEAATYLLVVSHLVNWATGTASLALDVHEIFHPDTISDFMPTVRHTLGDFMYNRALNALTQMGDTLVHTNQTQTPPPGYGMSHGPMFDETDFQGLADWADSLSGPGRRRDADAMLAFCGGAGLTDVELFHARAQDIVFRDDGVFIFVPGEFPRSVPVHFFWEDGVRARFSGTAPRAHLILPGVPRSRRRPTGVTPGFRSAAADPAQLSTRLRATWLERTAALLEPVAAGHFSGFRVDGGPASARELVKTIDFTASAAILRGAGEGW
ncbi:hypothetical protein [Conyzicola sp.]|uniref:hypothetical protein n=1 Tax=Conyzicola sp. TaxID=1969404 RepID=UPI003989484B